MTEEYNAINMETNESNKIIKDKDKNEEKIRENEPLPPIPIIIDKDLPEIPSEENNLAEGSIKESTILTEEILDEEYLPKKESDNIIPKKESDSEVPKKELDIETAKDEFKKEIVNKEVKVIDFE